MTPFGYTNFAPFITAIVTCIVFVLLLLVYCITGKRRMAIIASNMLCVCAIFSLGPLVFGVRYFSVVGILITASLVAELLLLLFAMKETKPAE